jgi:eukaryotic-like serine/threonine-protein kinase
LVGKLLDLYRNDPDAGIHGAAEWALRKWKQDARITNLDAELSKLKDRGDRRWYVNSQGQTFAMIEAPVEFNMGSPPSETDRNPNEILHRSIIPRRFSIAAREVTIREFRAFVKENPRGGYANPDRYSPDLDGPRNYVNWYQAAAYCNWLSRKENLPESYEPNERGEYNEGMRIKADALKLTGYRLPTEAEWEYTCRSGAATSRYFGSGIDLLVRYARYLQTSQDRAWPCGSLLPNDLGCSDMLGNVYEWCQDGLSPYRTGTASSFEDNITKLEPINAETPRLLRGGAFSYPHMDARSALRGWSKPSNGDHSFGLRLARTLP